MIDRNMQLVRRYKHKDASLSKSSARKKHTVWWIDTNFWARSLKLIRVVPIPSAVSKHLLSVMEQLALWSTSKLFWGLPQFSPDLNLSIISLNISLFITLLKKGYNWLQGQQLWLILHMHWQERMDQEVYTFRGNKYPTRYIVFLSMLSFGLFHT